MQNLQAAPHDGDPVDQALGVPALLPGRSARSSAVMAICHLWNAGGHGTAVALLGVAAVLAVALSRRRPTIPDRQPPTAG